MRLARAARGGPWRPHQISVPGELVETGRDLDGAVARACGERDGNAVVSLSRRRAIELEGEALYSGSRARDRRRHRQGPLRCWAFREQGDGFSRRRRDVDDDARSSAAILAAD